MAWFSSFFLLLVCCCLPLFARAGAVTDLRLTNETPGQTRLTLISDEAFSWRAFALDAPKRLVIDLPRLDWRAPLNKGDRNGFIKAYRWAPYQNDVVRLVLELNKPLAVVKQSSSLDNGQWRHVLELKPVSAEQFRKNLGKALPGPAASTAPAPVAATDAPALPAQKATQTAPAATTKPLIVIDAGHGGVDPGALAGNGAFEKNITLAVAREVKRKLEDSGKYRVKLTRDSDIYIKLPDRVRIARSAGADMFISLHADTIGRPEVRGASVYTLSERASDIESAKLAERENAVDSLVNVDVGQVDADVADILIDLVTRDTMNQSKTLAQTMVTTFKANGLYTLPISPHRSAGFAVLKSPDIPSILIEMGYLSNRTEADQLSSAAYRARLGSAVAKIIDRYFSETSKQAMY